MGKLKQLWINLRSSLWFVPTLIVLGLILLGLAAVEADQHLGAEVKEKWPRLLAAEAEGSRAMLSAIAGSMITVAGVAFSITIVALALASTQYTSRVLREFMKDPANQIVLGVFLGIFAYCLVVLRTISSSGGGTDQPAPGIAVLTGVVLALFGIGFLIFFIHHISSTIQASTIISLITKETIESIERLFPEELGDEAEEESEPDIAEAQTDWIAVPSQTTGYIQAVAADSLLEFARERKTIVRMERSVGEFIVRGRPLVSIAAREEPDEKLNKELNNIFAIDSFRTVEQDAEFGIRQLVDISLKALSPGINDTSTAIICIDHLSAILQCAVTKRIESSYRYDGEELRVIARGTSFQQMLGMSFNQILENGEGNTAILMRMLDSIGSIGEITHNAGRREALFRQVQVIGEVAENSVKTSQARNEVMSKVETLSHQIRGSNQTALQHEN